MIRGLGILALCLCATVSVSRVARPRSPPITVRVEKVSEQSKERITYRYEVENRSSPEITMLDIGYDREHGDVELTVPPKGWSGGHPAFKSPTGWKATVEAEEDTLLLCVEWGIDTTGVQPGIARGRTLGGFEVSIPRADDKYEFGHWTAYVNGNPFAYTGKIQTKQSRGK